MARTGTPSTEHRRRPARISGRFPRRARTDTLPNRVRSASRRVAARGRRRHHGPRRVEERQGSAHRNEPRRRRAQSLERAQRQRVLLVRANVARARRQRVRLVRADRRSRPTASFPRRRESISENLCCIHELMPRSARGAQAARELRAARLRVLSNAPRAKKSVTLFARSSNLLTRTTTHGHGD